MYSTWLDLAADCSEEEILHMVNTHLETYDELLALRERMQRIALRAELEEGKRKGRVPKGTQRHDETNSIGDPGGTRQGEEGAAVRRGRSMRVTVVHESKGMGYGTGGRVKTAAELRNERLKAMHMASVEREARAVGADGGGGSL